MSEANTRSVRVEIDGRVQGVWFRAWTREEAERRGLSGWVRNRIDGRVEAAFSGPAEQVDSMLAACWNGPPAASVSAVEVFEDEAPPDPGFRVLPTA